MRNEDIKNLKQPVEVGNYFESEKAFKKAIGVSTPNTDLLVDEVAQDLDQRTNGIQWWMNLPLHERILISDYLYQSITTIDTNLVEAKLHFLEWLDTRDHQNQRIANAVFLDSRGDLSVKTPAFTSPYDHVPHRLQDLHLAGFLRSIGSTLDCLAATIVAVLGLPNKMRRSGIGNTLDRLQKVDKTLGAGAELQANFYTFFVEARNSCGPNDWLDWADQYRNVFVHRGRRIVYQELTQRKPIILDTSARPLIRTDEISHLPKYPDRSEIEAFIKSKDVVLNENAEITLSGILNSTCTLVEKVSIELRRIWLIRRQSPLLIEQPIAQWSDLPKQCSFTGYDTNAKQLEMDVLISNPMVRFRMEMGAVTDSQRHHWSGSELEN